MLLGERKEKKSNSLPSGPFDTELNRSGWITDVRALDKHSANQHLIVLVIRHLNGKHETFISDFAFLDSTKLHLGSRRRSQKRWQISPNVQNVSSSPLPKPCQLWRFVRACTCRDRGFWRCWFYHRTASVEMWWLRGVTQERKCRCKEARERCRSCTRKPKICQGDRCRELLMQ